MIYKVGSYAAYEGTGKKAFFSSKEEAMKCAEYFLDNLWEGGHQEIVDYTKGDEIPRKESGGEMDFVYVDVHEPTVYDSFEEYYEELERRREKYRRIYG